MSDPEKAPIKASPKFSGSCACGRMTYECMQAPIPGATNTCFCVTCRKLSGGAYQAFTDVRPGALVYFDHHEHLRYEGLPKDNIDGIVFIRFLKSGAAERAFCISCYTPLAMRYKHQPGVINVVLGSVDESSISDSKIKEALQLQSHIFTSQRASWCNIDGDGLPQHARFSGRFEKDMQDWENGARGAE